MLRSAAAVSVVFALVIVSACAEGEHIPVPDFGDSGPPNGFEACREVFFGAYLKICKDFKDCTGVLECDVTKKFSTTPRCHVRLCERDDQCEEAFKTRCTGDDFHYACTRANPLVPEECRIIQGPKP